MKDLTEVRVPDLWKEVKWAIDWIDLVWTQKNWTKI